MKFYPIKGYEDSHEISRTGVVKSIDRVVEKRGRGTVYFKGKILKQKIDRYGYPVITLCTNNKKKYIPLHRLLCLTFKKNLKNYPVVNHKDGNKLNWNLNNLEWCTVEENNIHAQKEGLLKGRKGEKHHGAKLTKKDIIDIRNSKNTVSELFKKYKMSYNGMRDIVTGKNWKHV